MIADHRFQALEAVRLSLSVLSQPAQRLASARGEMVSRVTMYSSDQGRLLRENRELKAKLLENSAAAQQAKLLIREQEQLLGMAPGKTRYTSEGMIAEVLYAAR